MTDNEPSDGTALRTNETTITAEPGDQSIVITRVIDAPRERVFAAYTDPARIPKWWGPRAYTTAVDEMDVKPRGTWRFITHIPAGDEYAFYGVYYDVTEPERIAQTFGMDNTPGIMQLVTVTFEDFEGATTLTIRAVYPTVNDRDEDLEVGGDGAIETVERLAELLEADEGRSVTVSRVIAASPQRIYEAFLDPEELAAWLPPTGFSAEVHHLEPEEGGTFRITFTGETEEFTEYGHSFGGTYQELVPSERIVHTDEFETEDPGMAGEMTVTVTFEAVPDGTEVTVRQEGIPEAVPVDDAGAGWTESLENLARRVEVV